LEILYRIAILGLTDNPRERTLSLSVEMTKFIDKVRLRGNRLPRD